MKKNFDISDKTPTANKNVYDAIDWSKYKIDVDKASGKSTTVDASSILDRKVFNDFVFSNSIPMSTIPAIPAIPLKSLQDKFVVKTKDGIYFFSANKKKTLDYDAKTFDSVMEALAFADCISEETIVDKL
jgi:hypothetical protein